MYYCENYLISVFFIKVHHARNFLYWITDVLLCPHRFLSVKILKNGMANYLWMSIKAEINPHLNVNYNSSQPPCFSFISPHAFAYVATKSHFYILSVSKKNKCSQRKLSGIKWRSLWNESRYYWKRGKGILKTECLL